MQKILLFGSPYFINSKDKSVIINKLNFLETLMKRYLHIAEEIQIENAYILKFVRENVKKDTEMYDVEFDRDMLNDWIIGIAGDSKLFDIENMP